ncbi:MAG TPA: SDR family oxidoreductase [Aestuariivirgaceae bacterium]|jgi:NAD(P)-dependent dehydrogenase (short-subunit alcohol dehydrogenase family)
MADKFANRRILITGSTRGLGYAAAQEFLEQGAEVVIHGKDESRVRKVTSELANAYRARARGFAADLNSRTEQDRLAEFAGELDVLVNCAGVYEERFCADATENHWKDTIEINLTAAWRLARALSPGLKARNGVIVNIGSDSALLGFAGSVAYCASKGALVGLTRALAVELAPHVRALCVCPGPVDTDMMRNSVAAQPDPVAARRQWESFPILKRVATPKEIAEAILFAASPTCSFQTGSLIVVDGGTTAGRIV